MLTYIGLLIFNVKYPLLLAGIAAVMSLIPIFGSILSSIPIVAIALVSSGQFDLRQGVKVTGWIIFIHLIEANFLNPKIMGDAAKIHPVVVVFALIAGEHSYGLVGALFAVPVASIIQTLFVYFRKKENRHTGQSGIRRSRPSGPSSVGRTVRGPLRSGGDGELSRPARRSLRAFGALPLVGLGIRRRRRSRPPLAVRETRRPRLRSATLRFSGSGRSTAF